MHSLDPDLVHELRASRLQLPLQVEIREAPGGAEALGDDVDQKPRVLLPGDVEPMFVLICFFVLLANFERPVLGCIRIRIRSRLVFEKKENLGVRAKQKVRMTRLGKYYVVQYYTLYRCAEKSISLFRLPM